MSCAGVCKLYSKASRVKGQYLIEKGKRAEEAPAGAGHSDMHPPRLHIRRSSYAVDIPAAECALFLPAYRARELALYKGRSCLTWQTALQAPIPMPHSKGVQPK